MKDIALASVPPMTITVIGAGGIGSTFAYKLARAGHNVTVIARPNSVRLRQLQRDCGIIHANGERAEMHIAEQLDENIPYDIVLVTTLAHQVDALLPVLERSKSRSIHCMFNIFDPERLKAAIGDRCTFGMPFVMATIGPDGTLRSTINPKQKTLHGDRRLVELFSASGIPSAFEPNMLLWLRCHTPMCIAMESISVAGQRRGGGASWSEAMVVARGFREGFSVVKGLGYQLYPQPKAVLNATPIPLLACLLWSASRITTFRELLATGVNECRALIDVIAAAALDAQPALTKSAEAVLAMKPAE